MPRPLAYPDLSASDPDPDASDRAAAEWAEHVAAGRIGTRAAADPAVAERRMANDALFRERARRRLRARLDAASRE